MHHDLNLMKLLKSGDPEALDILLERYRPYVQLVVRCQSRGQLARRVDCSDIVQDALLQAARNVGQFQGQDEVEWQHWLGRIAERQVIEQLRKHLGAEKRALHRERAFSPESGSGALLDWLIAPNTSPPSALARKEQEAWLTVALSRLADDHREILALRHFEELSFPEIAIRMERTEGAVRVLWVRALKKLRDAASDDFSLRQPGS